MTALLVLLLLFTALALAAVRWGADTRVSAEWRWDREPAAPAPAPNSSPTSSPTPPPNPPRVPAPRCAESAGRGTIAA